MSAYTTVLVGTDGSESSFRAGDPVDEPIVTQRGVDLVVIGNRGLNSPAGRLPGSVPANISHRATCDVLVVHTTGKAKKQA